MFEGQTLQFVDAQRVADLQEELSAELALRVYAAVIEAMKEECSLNEDGVSVPWNFEASATSTLYVADNLPQMDVNRLADASNAETVATTLGQAVAPSMTL